MKKENWRGLLIFGMFGNKMHITTRDVRHLVTHPLVAGFAFLIVALLVLFDVNIHPHKLPAEIRTVLWTIIVLSFFVIYTVLALICIAISKKITWFFVYSPAIVVVAMMLDTVFGNYLHTVASGETGVIGPTDGLLFNIAAGLIFDTLFFLFVFPVAMIKLGTTAKSPTSKGQHITIAGAKFPLDEIYSISSQDHYVEVKTLTSCSLHRARLADVVAQMPEGHGIVPHRSHWVARFAVDEMGGVSAARFLKLTSGVEIPISRGRSAEVKDWLDE